MNIVVDLLLREVAMLGVLSAVGSGVAAFLPVDGRVGSRIALAPGLGLALASGPVFVYESRHVMRDTIWRPESGREFSSRFVEFTEGLKLLDEPLGGSSLRWDCVTKR